MNSANKTEQDTQRQARIHVAHCYRDETGMLRSRDGYLELNAVKPCAKGDAFPVSFSDTGTTETVPARQLQILGVDYGGHIQVVHVSSDVKARKGIVTCPGTHQETVCVKFTDNDKVEEVHARDLMLIGFE